MTKPQTERCRARLRRFITRAGGPAKVAAAANLSEITVRQWCMDGYQLPKLASLAALRKQGLDLNKLVA